MALVFWNRVHNDPSGSVIDFCTNQKRIYDFLLDFNSNRGPITVVLSCCVSEILELLYAESRFFDTPYSGQNFGVFPLE